MQKVDEDKVHRYFWVAERLGTLLLHDTQIQTYELNPSPSPKKCCLYENGWEEVLIFLSREWALIILLVKRQISFLTYFYFHFFLSQTILYVQYIHIEVYRVKLRHTHIHNPHIDRLTHINIHSHTCVF